MIKRIADRKKIEEKAMGLAKFPSENPSPVFRITKEGKMIYANRAALRLASVWKVRVGGYVSSSLRESIIEAFDFRRTIEHEIISKNRLFLLSITPIRDEGYVNVYGLDITDRRKAEEFTDSIINSLADVFYVFNLRGELTKWNTALERVSGYNKEEISTMKIGDFFYADAFKIVAKEIANVVRRGYGSVEAEIQTKDKRIIPYVFSGSLMRNQEGRRIICGIGKDISERRRAEERYRVLFESSSDAIMTLEPPNWNFTSGNPAAVKLFGAKDEKEFISKDPWKLSSEKQPDGLPSVGRAKKMIEIAMEKGANLFEWRHKRINGEEFPATVLLTRMEIADKTFLQATVRDISSQKIAEERIQRASQEWTDTFNSISDFVFILDQESTIIKANRAFLAAIKMNREDVVGKKCYEIVHKNNVPWPNCPHQKTITDGKAHTEQVDDPGLGLPLLITTSPILNEYGETSGSVHIAKDISEIVRTENELKKLKEKLEVEAQGLKEANDGIMMLNKQLEEKNKELGELDQLKSDFVSVVSHELRTPLSITKEGISLVIDEIPGKINDKQKNVLNTSKDNIDRLGAIINDLLDISKIEAGKVELKKSLVDISGLVREVCKEWVAQVNKKKQELLFSLPKETVNTYIDRNKIIQVMNNLISNAIKYTPEKGRIKIELKDEKDQTRVSVSDTGIGIAKEDLPKAFGKFQQFSRTAGAGPKGTGLGLAICKQIVQMHQGKIGIESQIDKGTKLTFWLPKMESEKIFKEYINNGIRETVDRNNSMSLVMITLKGFSSLQKKLGQEKAHELLRCFEKAIQGCLRRKADTVVRDSGELVVLLLDTNKEAVDLVKKRIEEAVAACISEGKEEWYKDLKITIGGATYPDEATSDDELLKKSRRQE